jgi:hypothetical protein
MFKTWLRSVLSFKFIVNGLYVVIVFLGLISTSLSYAQIDTPPPVDQPEGPGDDEIFRLYKVSLNKKTAEFIVVSQGEYLILSHTSGLRFSFTLPELKSNELDEEFFKFCSSLDIVNQEIIEISSEIQNCEYFKFWLLEYLELNRPDVYRSRQDSEFI